MKQDFSKYWVSSKKPKKQRKYLAKAPMHTKRKFISALLSKELRKKFNRRSIVIRKDDKVKILRGQFKKNTGKVTKLLMRKNKIYIDSVQLVKKDGTKAFYPLSPSNVMVTELFLDDKYRKKILDRNIKNVALKKT